jgi:hypothetical protein
MNYKAEINRSSPAAILMVIDQSTSMNHRLQTGQTKATFLADVLNKTLYTLVTNCSKADGIRDYFHVGVIAYSGTSARSGFQGNLATERLPPISRIADTPLPGPRAAAVQLGARANAIFCQIANVANCPQLCGRGRTCISPRSYPKRSRSNAAYFANRLSYR